MRNSTYRKALLDQDEEITELTASRDLGALAAAGLLVPHGKGRGRYYTAGEPVRAVRGQIVTARERRDDGDPFA